MSSEDPAKILIPEGVEEKIKESTKASIVDKEMDTGDKEKDAVESDEIEKAESESEKPKVEVKKSRRQKWKEAKEAKAAKAAKDEADGEEVPKGGVFKNYFVRKPNSSLT
jgi:hypothetical protein